ncbi:MAG: AbrB/MazE/SpoVT family DNA-binding domain-containing protein [Spirochaetae bacterium HGW-Spirochaetae-1]|jgi:antitoxin MazE|nr:MAG: AbrB/MazE/SpoVT family DNA-binding domain-containing protein [Spirochaetae bacterium HGW-Spirochaetae-1]
MIIKIVPIGNSKGIRIPNYILQQLQVDKQIELVFDETKSEIILKPIKEIRQGWSEAFKKMNSNSDDSLIIDDSIDLNDNDWEW